jgi:hypothetical protein
MICGQKPIEPASRRLSCSLPSGHSGPCLHYEIVPTLKVVVPQHNGTNVFVGKW